MAGIGQVRDVEPRRPTVTTTTINGLKFVSGLFWQALHSPRHYMKEAKDIGKRDGLEMVAIRDTVEVKQAGFVVKTDGVTKGMYSLAAALAGQLGDTWIGAFKLPDGRYAIVAVVGGSVLPGSDKIGDFDTISKLLKKLFSRGTEFKEVYAPPEMGFGGEDLDIETLLKPSNLNKAYTLKPLTFGLTKKEWYALGVAGVALLALAIGGWQWHLKLDREEKAAALEAARIEAQRLAELNAKTRAEQVAPALKHQWAQQASLHDFVTACLSVANSKPLSISGWPAGTATCSNDQYAVSYKRTGTATVNQFIVAARAWFELVPAFTSGGDTALLNQSLAMTLAGDEELGDLDSTLAGFTSHFQQVKIKPTLVEIPYKAPPQPAALPGSAASDLPPPPLPDWTEFSFSIESEIPPEILIQGMSSRGIRITEIVIEVKESARMSWTIKGALYAKK
ncbi:type 4b pilus protein PilO2 [Pseudomonas siliginis]|uniref:type 4b pilus protein PilO2 n=1 Tax=Pseudomonas siliginis TaxID=2842346 RepID=UPI00209206FE|nr:type 4b pilus protein PilO2 [Pseudomonas siliginis]UST77205.1 type 4b pilus protein PilO2 [Pseudomonas siliginis]